MIPRMFLSRKASDEVLSAKIPRWTKPDVFFGSAFETSAVLMNFRETSAVEVHV